MYRRLLVPSDLTDHTIAALEAAASIATASDARITVLHVIETIAGADFEELSSFYRGLEQKAVSRLGDIIARTAGVRIQVDTVIAYGKRVEEVLRFIRANDVDLVVLASHRIDPAEPYAGLGTMSYKLGTLSPCAVLLVK